MYKEQFIFLKSLVSSKNEKVTKETLTFLEELHYESIPFDGNIFFIETGGSEEIFLKIYQKYPAPYHLIATNMNNSLPSALEIISYLKERNISCYLYHGSPKEVREALLNKNVDASTMVYSLKNNIGLLTNKRIGVIGKPSDWLISSEVDYIKANEVFNVTLIDVPFLELLNLINIETSINISKLKDKINTIINEKELIKAFKIYNALKKIINKYQLDALTIRCFDLLNSVHSTGCIALSLLNSEGIPSSCEGDIPSLLSMMLLKELFKVPSFQCNPSYFNVKDNFGYLAHCTIPLSMCKDFSLDTHFESGIGVGIHGELKESEVTLFKINANLDKFVAYTGKIIENTYKDNLCRTQIKVHFDDNVSSLLSSPLGNHLLLIYGNRIKEIIDQLAK